MKMSLVCKIQFFLDRDLKNKDSATNFYPGNLRKGEREKSFAGRLLAADAGFGGRWSVNSNTVMQIF